MPSALSTLVVIGLAQLFTFTALRLRYGNDCSGSYQPRDMTEHVPGRSLVVHENEPLSSNAVADALLMLAVAKHVKGGDIRRHIELAQVAKEEMASGIESGTMEAEARDAFIKILKAKRA